MTKILIIGGGPAGCIAAHFLHCHGFNDVTLVEKGDRLGGSSCTYYYGGHPYTFGPRHFLTKYDRVWEYMNNFCPMKRYPGHEFLTYIEKDKQFYHFPIHRDEVQLMPDATKINIELEKVAGAENAKNIEDYWINSVGITLYNKFVKNYTNKMWSIKDNRLIIDYGHSVKGVSLKTGENKGAWSEAYSGFPLAKDGYDDYFDLAASYANIYLNTMIEDYNIPARQVKIDGAWTTWDIIINTISPEYLFDQCYGELRWMGRDFQRVVLPAAHLPGRQFFPENVFFLYYANQEPFTRIVEYKKFYEWDKDSPTTLLGIEIPSFSNKLYPFPMQADYNQAQKYLDLLPTDVYSIGRMGSYRYLDMGNIIEQCFDLIEKL